MKVRVESPPQEAQVGGLRRRRADVSRQGLVSVLTGQPRNELGQTRTVEVTVVLQGVIQKLSGEVPQRTRWQAGPGTAAGANDRSVTEHGAVRCGRAAERAVLITFPKSTAVAVESQGRCIINLKTLIVTPE